MMDYNIGDHNAFSKLCVGWIDNPILVNLENKEETIITIDALTKNGDCIIICDNYDESKGMFQDYFLVQLIDMDSKLNNNQFPYTSDGIRIYRVHGELEITYEDEKEYTYFKYDNSYTRYNLLDAINNNKAGQIYSFYEYNELCADDSDLFFEEDYITNLTYYDTSSTKSDYRIEVLSIVDNKATIRIYKI